MLVSFWSVKGGSGTTVVAAALALLLAERSSRGSLLADLAGDAAAVLGIPDPEGPGLTDWLRAGGGVPVDALSRLEVDAGPGLALLPRGAPGPTEPGRAGVLASLLAGDPRPVVADCGTLADEPSRTLAAEATISLLVTRPCYLALRKALRAPLQPSGVVLVVEEGRSLGRADVEDVLGVPVRAEIPVHPAVARAVDAGLLAARLPRKLGALLGVA